MSTWHDTSSTSDNMWPNYHRAYYKITSPPKAPKLPEQLPEQKVVENIKKKKPKKFMFDPKELVGVENEIDTT